MIGDAKFSECGRYRWWLTRVWDSSLLACCLIGMNPSTATAIENDPTVGKEIHFVKSWGFGSLLKLNAFAFKATDPRDLYSARARGVDVIGRENTAANMVETILLYGNVGKIVASGGTRPEAGFNPRLLPRHFSPSVPSLYKRQQEAFPPCLRSSTSRPGLRP